MPKDLLFSEQKRSERAAKLPNAEPWTVLVVDDDPEVHSVTRLILGRLRWQGRGLRLLDAFSAAEARRLLDDQPDIAVILLDVVMETDHAGLDLVRHIRGPLSNSRVRIILRTGQPGQAPEESVIVDCDINDYKEKTELTSQKLTTTVVAALRSYRDIIALDMSRRGLQRIIDSSESLLGLRRLAGFAPNALATAADFLEAAPAADAVLAARHAGGAIRFLAGRGAFADGPGAATSHIEVILAERRHLTFADDNHTGFFIAAADELALALILRFPRRLSELEQVLLETLIAKITVGFANVHHYEQLIALNAQLEARVSERTRELAEANRALERLSVLDPLTGILNRRQFGTLAEREMARARRSGRPFALLMLDIDHFKRINDTFGHAAGDEALKALADTCQARLRDIDVFARLGGEEFVILLPEGDLADGMMAAERLRADVANIAVPSAAGRVTYTTSIGVAQWVPLDDSIAPVLERADSALYQAKRGGRNQVIAARPGTDDKTGETKPPGRGPGADGKDSHPHG